MEITTVIGVGILGAILSVTVKNYRPELGIAISVLTGVAIFFMAARSLENVVSGIYSMCEKVGVDIAFFKVVVKVIAIAYITQFASELCRDSGERAIAKKLEMAGKTAVIAAMLPIIKSLLDTVVNTLMSF